MKILIIQCNQTHEAKRYPYWDGLEELLTNHEVKKIETKLSEKELIDLTNWCDVWVTIDSFFPHFVQYHKLKPGIVIWGKSDPKIFGYEENVNLLRHPRYLREEQFKWWQSEKYDKDVFVSPSKIKDAIDEFVK